MSHSNRTSTNRRRQSLLVVVIALLGVVAFGAFTSIARAEDPLLARVPVGTCANESNNNIDWPSTDLQRAAVACLINQVRARSGLGLPQLFYCTTANTCNYYYAGTSPLYSQANASALYLAAQWKALDVDYGIDEPNWHCYAPNNGSTGLRYDILQQYHWGTTPPLNPDGSYAVDDGTLAYTYASPHQACGRPIAWWDDFTHVYRTPLGLNVPNFKENIAPGFTRVYVDKFTGQSSLTPTANTVVVDTYRSPRQVVNGWLDELPPNDGHRKAILDPTMVMLGVGVSPAWYGNIAAAPPSSGGLNWGTYRQVYSAQFIR
jgi:hypothetical protein